MWGWLKAIQAFFGFGTAVTNAVTKGMDSEKVKEEKFEIEKPKLITKADADQAEVRNRIADEMFHDLEGHPELSVSDKVNFELKEWSEDDKTLLIKILTDRLNDSPKYQRKKNKPSKFRLPKLFTNQKP